MHSFPVPERDAKREITRMLDEHGAQLTRLCYLLIGDLSLAEDAVQETFVNAYRGYASFRGESSEKTWLTRIAVNACKNLNRSPWRRHVDRSISLDDLPEPSCACDPYDDSVMSEILKLPLKYRAVLLMHYYQDMKVDEIADALSVPRSTVSTRLCRARQKLKPVLERWLYQ